MDPQTQSNLPHQQVLQHYKFPFTLRPDQAQAIDVLCQWDRAGCYMDVGTGKTAVSTACAFYMGILGLVEQVIVIMPPILLLQWEAWLKSFPMLDVSLYRGTPAQRLKNDLSADFLLTTIGLFKNDFERLQKHFRDSKVMVIVDEAAMIRRPQTGNFKAVRDFLFLPNKSVMLLTGTAINSPLHCYGYIKLITPHIYRNFSQFKAIHVMQEDIFGEPTGYKNLDTLAENMLLQAIRIEAEDVINLPEVTYVPIHYELEPAHRKLYDRVVEELLVTLDDGEVIDALVPQRLYHQTQLLLLRPAEFGGEKIEPAAFKLIDQMAEEAGMFSGSGEKLLIYANHNLANESILAYVTKLKLNAVLVYGQNSPAKNAANVQKFLDDPAVQVMIAHPKSAGVGLNLQKVCRMVLFLELPITPNDFIQTVGRIKREGQTRKCIIWMALAKKTIQDRLKRSVVDKEDMIQTVMPTKETLRSALYGR
jgi:SNF2 family DNA or RNA helicase